MSKEIDQRILSLYQPKKLLGSGAYGHVWKVIQKSSKKQYALKKIFDAFQNAVDAQRTYRQITVLHQLDHSNIVKLKQVAKAANNRDLYLVFQYMQADLHSLVGQDVLQPVHLKFIIYQILKALKYLHSAQLIHRDLKPSNILINSQCQIKICDFGLVRSLTHEEDQQMVLSEEVATRWYRSPEILLSSRKYSKATDVWSVGCIIAQLLIGKPIFPGGSTLEQLDMIVQFCGMPSKQNIDSLQSQSAQNLLNQLSVRKKSMTDYFPPDCDKQLLEMVVKMLQFNPNKRITIEQAMNLPVLSQFHNGNKDQCQLCQKIIFPQIDDNVRLTVAKYRQFIYKDIERRYPMINMIVNRNSNNTVTSSSCGDQSRSSYHKGNSGNNNTGHHGNNQNNNINNNNNDNINGGRAVKFQRSHHSLKKIHNNHNNSHHQKAAHLNNNNVTNHHQSVFVNHDGKNSSSSLQKNSCNNTTSTMYSKVNNKSKSKEKEPTNAPGGSNSSIQQHHQTFHHSFNYQKVKDINKGSSLNHTASYIQNKSHQTESPVVSIHNSFDKKINNKPNKYANSVYNKHKQKDLQKQTLLNNRSQNSLDPNYQDEVNRQNKSKNKKIFKRIQESNPLKCYIVKNDKFLPHVRSKKQLLHKTTIKACKPLMDFQQKINQLRT